MCLIPKKERRCTPRFRIILSIVCLWSVHLLQCNLSFPLHSCICRYFTYAKKLFFISAFQDKLMGIVFKAHAVQQSFFPWPSHLIKFHGTIASTISKFQVLGTCLLWKCSLETVSTFFRVLSSVFQHSWCKFSIHLDLLTIWYLGNQREFNFLLFFKWRQETRSNRNWI